jgi:hypothetical protein
MGLFDTMPKTEAVSGNLLPIAIPHVMNQELAPQTRAALVAAFKRTLDDYLDSGMFNSRAAALRKWILTRDDVASLRGGQRQMDRIVYKEPFLSFAPEYVFEAIPGVRVVYIIRDGRDVADSLVRTYDVLTNARLADTNTNEALIAREHAGLMVPWWVDEGRDEEFLSLPPYARAAWMWAWMVRRCREFFADDPRCDHDRLLQVRYEELVQEPVAWGERIAEHFGTTMSKRMRQAAKSAHARSVGVHRRRDDREIAEATRVAAGELQAHGYG